MGKRRLQAGPARQARQQVRQVRPKAPAPPTTGAGQRKQRERYVQSGGMLQGYAPETVVRIGQIAALGAVACIAIAALIVLFLPYGWPVKVVASVVWLAPILFAASFIFPGYRLALQDRKLEPRVVQGQLLGASEVSTSIGLGMLMMKTRGSGNEQYLVTPDKLAKVPGNQVNVMLTVTPKLRHVRSVGVMGQRLMGRPEQPTPPVLRQLRLLPILTPVAISAAAVIGVGVLALIPIRPDWVHALIAVLAGAILVGAVFGASQLLQRRLYNEVQTLIPGGLPR